MAPETALVTHDEPPPPNTGKYRRLSDRDKALALAYACDGLTQVVIAQRLGVTQPAISQWLAKCQDTTAEAGLYLRGQALPMAEKIVKQGRPSDLVKVLQGVSVLAPEQVSGVTIQIGVKDSDVQIDLGSPVSS